MTYTIDQLPNTATEVSGDDYFIISQDGATKKITARDFLGAQSAGGLAFVGTRAEYETAKLIPEGSTGYIPSGTLVCITDEDSYTFGKPITVNRNRRRR